MGRGKLEILPWFGTCSFEMNIWGKPSKLTSGPNPHKCHQYSNPDKWQKYSTNKTVINQQNKHHIHSPKTWANRTVLICHLNDKRDGTKWTSLETLLHTFYFMLHVLHCQKSSVLIDFKMSRWIAFTGNVMVCSLMNKVSMIFRFRSDWSHLKPFLDIPRQSVW